MINDGENEIHWTLSQSEREPDLEDTDFESVAHLPVKETFWTIIRCGCGCFLMILFTSINLPWLDSFCSFFQFSLDGQHHLHSSLLLSTITVTCYHYYGYP